jgi:hypothetical protein
VFRVPLLYVNSTGKGDLPVPANPILMSSKVIAYGCCWPKARLRGIDQHLDRLRSENPPLARPLDYLRAVRSAQIETGRAALIFGWRKRRVYAGLLVVSLTAAVLLLSLTGLFGAISTGVPPAWTPGKVVALIFSLIMFTIGGWLGWLIWRER